MLMQHLQCTQCNTQSGNSALLRHGPVSCTRRIRMRDADFTAGQARTARCEFVYSPSRRSRSQQHRAFFIRDKRADKYRDLYYSIPLNYPSRADDVPRISRSRTPGHPARYFALIDFRPIFKNFSCTTNDTLSLRSRRVVAIYPNEIQMLPTLISIIFCYARDVIDNEVHGGYLTRSCYVRRGIDAIYHVADSTSLFYLTRRSPSSRFPDVRLISLINSAIIISLDISSSYIAKYIAKYVCTHGNLIKS